MNFGSIEKCGRGRGREGRQEQGEEGVQELQLLTQGKYQEGHSKWTVGEGQKCYSGLYWSYKLNRHLELGGTRQKGNQKPPEALPGEGEVA